MDPLLILEIFAVAMGVLFIILLIAENVWCWLFGILSSLAYIFLMYYSKLYSESILYVFYVGIGFYGWYQWSRVDEQKPEIKRTPIIKLIFMIMLGGLASYVLGSYFANNTDANRPYEDAGSTVFSLIASFMEAHKWLSAWIFWIIINAFSIWLYFDRSLNLSSFLMLIYFLLSLFGYIQWRKKLLLNEQ